MRRSVPRVILTLFGAFLVPGSTFGGIVDELYQQKPSEPRQMVNSLRRQLMTNNYDYISTDTEEFPRRHDSAPADTPAPPSLDGQPLPPELVNDIYVPRVGNPGAPVVQFNSNLPPDGIAKNPYYLDDERLKQRAKDADGLEPYNPPDTNLMNEFETTSPKAKYKFIKVRTEGTRRSGGPSFRRFLQEEGGDGVAIINLDGDTFPQLRLPSNRRQYMSDNDGDDEGAV